MGDTPGADVRSWSGAGPSRGLAMACVLWLVVLPVQAAPDGDINSDSQTDIGDLLWGIQALSGQRTLTLPQQEQGDMASRVLPGWNEGVRGMRAGDACC